MYGAELWSTETVLKAARLVMGKMGKIILRARSNDSALNHGLEVGFMDIEALIRVKRVNWIRRIRDAQFSPLRVLMECGGQQVTQMWKMWNGARNDEDMVIKGGKEAMLEKWTKMRMVQADQAESTKVYVETLWRGPGQDIREGEVWSARTEQGYHQMRVGAFRYAPRLKATNPHWEGLGCPLCGLATVEDNRHLLFECASWKVERNEWFLEMLRFMQDRGIEAGEWAQLFLVGSSRMGEEVANKIREVVMGFLEVVLPRRLGKLRGMGIVSG